MNKPIIPAPRGCECLCSAHGDHENAPVAFEVRRRIGDGEIRTMRVCTKCDLRSDISKILIVTEDTESKPYEEWDFLGWFCITSMLAEERERKTQ